jgi:hypothetical protein
LAITLIVVGAVLVAAFFSGVGDDPCERDGSAGTVAVLVGLLLFGVASYLIASRLTTRGWLPVAVTIATVVVGYYAVTTVALLVYWVPNCAN